MKVKKMVLLALFTAIALTIFMIEAQIPALVPIPGVKIGLSNIVTVFVVFAAILILFPQITPADITSVYSVERFIIT